ncbi:MAG: ABC transporter permease [Spirochaetes bacterium]|nr:ABC transporter permease [Spirochaetota bacterium]
MNWDFSVSAKTKLLDIKLRELISYRDLIFMFFLRDFTVVYKQTILGPIWHIVNPLLSTLVFAFLFSGIAGMGTDGVPLLLFYFSGTMLWTFYSNCFNNAAGIFITNAGVFGKIYFPRLAVPIAATFSATLKMLIQFVLLMAFFAYYILAGNPVRPTAMAMFFPLLILWLGALGTGIGMVMSALTTKYRDFNLVLGLLLQLTMFVTPVVYPLSQVPDRFRLFFYVNPLSAPIELFRIWFYGAGWVSPHMVLASLGMTAAILLAGLILFTHVERTFMDVI